VGLKISVCWQHVVHKPAGPYCLILTFCAFIVCVLSELECLILDASFAGTSTFDTVNYLTQFIEVLSSYRILKAIVFSSKIYFLSNNGYYVNEGGTK